MTVCRLLAAVGAGGQLNLPESNRQPEAAHSKKPDPLTVLVGRVWARVQLVTQS